MSNQLQTQIINSSSFIHIDSNNRLSGTPEDFKVLINDITYGNDKNLSIENLIIPFSYYAINNNNNAFTVSYGTTGTASAILTNGNYTSAEFITELETQLNALSLGSTFTASISGTNNKLSLLGSTAIPSLSIISNTKNNRHLGLAKNSSKAFSSTAWVSDNVIDLSGTKYISVETNLPISTSNTSNQNHNVLARVYPNCSPFDFINYTSQSFQFLRLNTNRINDIQLTLRDDNSDILDLNGAEWALTLEIQDF